MGVLAAMQPRVDQWKVAPQGQADDRDDVKPSWLEGVAASFRTGQDLNAWHQAERVADGYTSLVQDLARSTGKDPSAYLAKSSFEYAGLHNPFTQSAPAQAVYDADAVWADVAALRQRDPNALKGLTAKDQQAFEQDILSRHGRFRVDAQTVAKSGLSANLIGGAGAAFTDPLNVVFGGAGGGIVGRAGSLAKGVLLDSLLNAGLEVAQTRGNIDARARLGQKSEPGDIARDIGAAALMGGGMHLGIAGLNAGARAAYDSLPLGYRAASALNHADLPAMSDTDLLSTFNGHVPEIHRTPDEQAAVHVLTRAADVQAASPYVDTYAGQAMHQQRLQLATQRLLTGTARQAIMARGVDSEIVSFFVGKGMRPEDARGIAAGIAAESGSNPRAVNPSSGALGLGQHLGARKAALIARFGENPTKAQQLEFLWEELNGGDAGGKHVLAARGEAAVLDAYIRKFMRPKAGAETDGDLARGMAALGRPDERMGGGAIEGAADGIDGETSAANRALSDLDAEAVRAGDALDGVMAPRVHEAIEAPHPSEDLPPLRADRFETPEAHRAAQAQANADALGIDNPTTHPVSEGVVGYTTSKGSIYDVHEDGTTTRNKAARSDAGHEGDSGLKDRSAKTVYVDSPEAAASLSAAGLQGLGSKGARVIIRDGKASLLTWNDAEGKWGVAPSGKDVPISNVPAIGKSPLELWKRADDVNGHEAYRGMHAGNEITEIRQAPNAADNQGAKLDAEGRSPIAGADSGLENADFARNDVSSDLASPAAEKLSDPVGAGAREQLDGLTHDLRGQIEAGALEGLTFITGEDGVARSASEILTTLEADRAALDALKGCL